LLTFKSPGGLIDFISKERDIVHQVETKGSWN
jgi:Holliday junction resolvase-like predicted endonuclease